MTVVLNRTDVNFLEEEVSEFERRRGKVLGDSELPEAFDCDSNCAQVCNGCCHGMCVGPG